MEQAEHEERADDGKHDAKSGDPQRRFTWIGQFNHLPTAQMAPGSDLPFVEERSANAQVPTQTGGLSKTKCLGRHPSPTPAFTRLRASHAEITIHNVGRGLQLVGCALEHHVAVVEHISA